MNAMSRYKNIKFVLISPPELTLPDYIKQGVLAEKNIEYIETGDLESAMPSLDILYMTRVQRERFFSTRRIIYVLKTAIFSILTSLKKREKNDLCILHPLPRVNEISTDVDSDARACYFKQALNGKYIRMALILKLLGVE
ncbi:MAG: hypothetical protein L6V93_03005 [Clostridiales bacterium]|nr:MAG: hypothetical protein L6V93_03005 [Clostridiales bacterium]